jgi:hypothetical protein
MSEHEHGGHNSHNDDASFSKTAIRDFIVEFLGGLVPGVAFLLALFPALIIPVAAVLVTFLPVDTRVLHHFNVGVNAKESVSLTTILFIIFPAISAFLVFAYIAGHLFFRQDPKKADERSFKRISKKGVRQDGMVREDAAGRMRVEFPYHFLKLYLTDRGLNYLGNRIPWEGKESEKVQKTTILYECTRIRVAEHLKKAWKSTTNYLRDILVNRSEDVKPEDLTFNRRAKHFANALKIRVQMEAPRYFPIIARNEAHVRLSSSMWFACRILAAAAVVGMIIYLDAASISRSLQLKEGLQFSSLFFLPLGTFLLCWLTKDAIERVLHYQREREVLFILEVAHWLCASGRCSDIFSGLEPAENDDFGSPHG